MTGVQTCALPISGIAARMATLADNRSRNAPVFSARRVVDRPVITRPPDTNGEKRQRVRPRRVGLGQGNSGVQTDLDTARAQPQHSLTVIACRSCFRRAKACTGRLSSLRRGRLWVAAGADFPADEDESLFDGGFV